MKTRHDVSFRCAAAAGLIATLGCSGGVERTDEPPRSSRTDDVPALDEGERARPDSRADRDPDPCPADPREPCGSWSRIDAGDPWCSTDITATALLDGSVLVVGACGLRGLLTQALLYRDGAFESVGPPGWGRTEHATVRLADGRVAVLGGGGGSWSKSGDVAIFDPESRHWSAWSSLEHPRSGHGAAQLADGRVLVAGGVVGFDLYGAPIATDSVEMLASCAPTAAAATIPGQWYRVAASPLPDGGAIAVGVDTLDGATSRAARYDAEHDEWAELDELAGATGFASATPLADGRVLVVLGTEARLFDPALGVVAASALLAQRGHHAAAPLPAGRVLLAGGGPWPDHAPEIFDAAAGTTRAAAPSALDHTGGAAAPLPDGRVLVIGPGGAEVFEDGAR